MVFCKKPLINININDKIYYIFQITIQIEFTLMVK